MPKRRNNLTS